MLKPRIAVLVSGGGTNLQSLIDAQESGRLRSGTLALVVASRAGVFALTRAENAGIAAETVDRAAYASQDAFEERLLAVLSAHRIDLVVLAGFLQILSGAFVSRYPDRIVNVHPSLIPAYCGKGFYGVKVHEAVLAAGEAGDGRHGTYGQRSAGRRADPHAAARARLCERHAKDAPAPRDGAGGVDSPAARGGAALRRFNESRTEGKR